MKKALFFALSLLVAATSFVGCKDKPEPTPDVTITFANTEIVLAPGDEQRLQYTIAPAGTSVTLTWATSNPAVATVSQSGIVTAQADGEAVITASYNNAKAECKVTVTNAAVYENFELVGYGLFGEEFVPIEGTETVLELSVGEVNAQLATINFIAWDGNVLYDEGWAGLGLIMETEIPVYIIIAGEKTTAASAAYGKDLAGYWISPADGWAVADVKGAGHDYDAYTAQSGSINVEDFGTLWSYMLDTTYCSREEAQAAYNNFVDGAYIYIVDADNKSWYSEYPYAVVNELAIGEDDNEELFYTAKLTWSDLYAADRFYGLKATFDEEGYVVGIVKPFDYATVGPRTYTNVEGAAPAKHNVYELGDMSLVHEEVPEFVMKARAARMDRMYRK